MIKAKKIAVKALEQEPCEDAISRKADRICDSCTNVGCIFQTGIVRTQCAFYMPPHMQPDNCGNYVIQEPKTKNDLVQERYQDLIEYFGDKETAKIILEDKKEFKAWLERVKWYVKRADELARELEQLGTAKNNLEIIDKAESEEE